MRQDSLVSRLYKFPWCGSTVLNIQANITSQHQQLYVYPCSGAMRLPKPAAPASARVDTSAVVVDASLPLGKDGDGTLPMEFPGEVTASVAASLQKEDERMEEAEKTGSHNDKDEEPVEVIGSFFW